MVEGSKESEEEIYIHGRDKPAPVEGREWYPVRGRDPSKSPNEISGWKLGSSPTPQGEFSLPSELEHSRGKLSVPIKQSDFFDKVDKSSRKKSAE